MQIVNARWIGSAATAVAIAGVAFNARPKPLEVDAASVVRGSLATTVEADGRTRVRDRYVVMAPVAGRVARLDHIEGDLVRAGDVLARIAPLPFDSVAIVQARLHVEAAEALVLQADAQVRIAAAALEQRRRQLSRAERLLSAGGVAPREVEEASLAKLEAEESLRSAQERSRGAQADAKEARAVLAGQQAGASAAVLVRAPASGRVLRIPERSERIVAAGTPLVEIGDPSSLEIVIDVLSSDGALVSPGDVVRLSEWAGASADESLGSVTGHVRDIEPAGFTKISALGVEEQRVNVIVDLDRTPQAIGDGYRVEASIVVWSAPSVTRVPRSALVQAASSSTGATSPGWTAFVVRDGRAEQRTVRIGHAGATDAEVIDGLEPGDRVIVFPSDQVADKTRIKPRA